MFYLFKLKLNKTLLKIIKVYCNDLPKIFSRKCHAIFIRQYYVCVRKNCKCRGKMNLGWCTYVCGGWSRRCDLAYFPLYQCLGFLNRAGHRVRPSYKRNDISLICRVYIGCKVNSLKPGATKITYALQKIFPYKRISFLCF